MVNMSSSNITTPPYPALNDTLVKLDSIFCPVLAQPHVSSLHCVLYCTDIEAAGRGYLLYDFAECRAVFMLRKLTV